MIRIRNYRPLGIYCKKTDTGLLKNFHALAPDKYKHSVVTGMVYRIFRACSTWMLINKSLEKAKKIIESNQYPPSFYEPIFKKTLHFMVALGKKTRGKQRGGRKSNDISTVTVHRGKLTEKFKHTLKRI